MMQKSSPAAPQIQQEFIPFVRSYLSERTVDYLKESLTTHQLQGDGLFTKKCHRFLEDTTACKKALLTHSCTAALEMAALLIDLKEGDEVIMPSFTFASTATSVALRKGIPVFVDIRQDTLNIDENLIEEAITSRTKAIFPVHYAGVSANMDAINRIAKKYDLFVVEDAAQGVGASYQKKPLGTLGDLGAYSFHGTKNIISGEGGALLINRSQFCERAEIIREKGTNRSQFLRGDVDKYTWQDIGSSYLPNELTAALLYAQLADMEIINRKRIEIWNSYHEHFKSLEDANLLSRPHVPLDCIHNAHIYYLILQSTEIRNDLLAFMKQRNIQCTTHYVPLHSSPAGLKYGRAHGNLSVTDRTADQIIRLPLWPDMTKDHITAVIEALHMFFQHTVAI